MPFQQKVYFLYYLRDPTEPRLTKSASNKQIQNIKIAYLTFFEGLNNGPSKNIILIFPRFLGPTVDDPLYQISSTSD